jgi:uncharacterized membrane protein YbaN (DUF454 family)
MLAIVRRLAALTVGSLLIVLGIVGIFLPFLQGFLLIALGLSVLSLASERVAGYVEALKRRLRELWRQRRGGEA